MTDNVANLILEHLRALRSELGLVKTVVEQINERLRSHDAAILDLRRSDVHGYEEHARQQVSLDRLSERVERIEKRFELHD